MDTKYKEGDVVQVSGPVDYGDGTYRVESRGEVVEWTTGKKALLLLEEVDGDRDVCVSVSKDCIYPLR